MAKPNEKFTGKYDHVVKTFLQERQGEILYIGDEYLFFRTLQGVVHRYLDIKRECLHMIVDGTEALKEVRQRASLRLPVLALVERRLEGQASSEFLYTLKRVFPEVKVIALTDETVEETLIYMHEVGADNILTKPASANDVIEKLAFTLKPPQKLTRLIEEAKRQLARGEYRQVVTLAREVLELKPGSPTAFMLMGDAFRLLGDRDKAIGQYRRAHENAPMFLEPIKRLVDVYRGYDEDACLKNLLLLNELSPLNIKRKFEIGRIYAKRKELDKAEEFFDAAFSRAVKEAISIVDNITEDIVDLTAVESPRLSAKYLRKLIDFKGANIGREDIGAFNRLGLALKQQGKFEEAVAVYEQALRIAPDDEGLLYNLGMVHAEAKRYREAAEWFEKALSQNPEMGELSPGVSTNIGSTYFQIGEFEKALGRFEEAMAAAPESEYAAKMAEACRAKLKRS